MALDERKQKAIGNIIKGENYSDVAKLSGVSRQALYNWLDDEEFKAELNRQIQELKTHGEQKMTARLDTYVTEIEKLALTSHSEKVKADCLQYLVNRILGTPAAKQADTVNDSDKDKNTQTPQQLQDELARFRLSTKRIQNE